MFPSNLERFEAHRERTSGKRDTLPLLQKRFLVKEQNAATSEGLQSEKDPTQS